MPSLTFLIATAIMLIIALLFIWFPVVKHRKTNLTLNRKAINISIFRDEQSRLIEAFEIGKLNETEYEEELDLLKIRLLEDTQGDESGAGSVSDIGYFERFVIPVALSVIIPASTLMLYLQWGSPDSVEGFNVAEARKPEAESVGNHLKQIEKTLDINDAQGWFSLGRGYLSMSLYLDAFRAFERVEDIVGEQAEILAQKAQALYYHNNHQLNDDMKKMIDRALELDPNDPGTLGFIGTYSYDIGNYGQAVEYWTKMLKFMDDEESKEQIRKIIKQVQQQMSQEVSATQSGRDESGSIGEPSINVTVNISGGLASMVSPSDTVYIYAVNKSVAPMPLAIIRQSGLQQGQKVVLDDGKAMAATGKLSMASSVDIIVLISKTGSVKPQPGDLRGIIRNVEVGPDVNLTVLVNETVAHSE